MRKKLLCRCGAESCEYEQGMSVGVISSVTGFGYVWNVEDGLSAIYLCPSCMDAVQTAWNTITQITRTRYVNLSHLTRVGGA